MLAAYTVAIRPNQHLFDVCLDLDGLEELQGQPLELWLPSWTPGSYLIREYARHLQNVRAEGEGGQPLEVIRSSEDSWRLTPLGHSRAKVYYSVYAFELTVRTCHLDESHAYFNGAALFLTCDALTERPAAITLSLPPGWRAETTLPKEPEREGLEGLARFRATTYDELCDSPVHAGPTGPENRAIEFMAAGVPHRLAVWGTGNEDLPSLVRDLTTLVEQTAAIFGGALPYRRYLFLTLLSDRGRGGLEHRDGATLLSPRFGFKPEKSRQEFLLLAAHELFHAWVVKRLRPRALLPYRYRTENLTRQLWFFEGFTSYYETLVCVRARLLSPARFLEIWGERLTQLARTPGRKVQSLEESSLTAWVKFYRPDENSANSAVSYYLKGSLVALALEGELRQRNKTVDGLMRQLWESYGVGEIGLPEEALLADLETFAGEPLPQVRAAIVGTDDPNFGALEALGLRVRTRTRDGQTDRGGTRPRPDRERTSTLGASLKADRPIVQMIVADGPAERAGLAPEDELIAADGFRLTAEAIGGRLEAAPPGTPVRLTYFRRDELRQTVLTLGERPLDTCWIERVDAPTDLQRQAFRAWTGGEL